MGRPWNKVYSEICENLTPDSAVQKHVRDHVWDYVDKDVVMRKKHPFVLSPWDGYRPLRKGDMFVHPDTGILCRVEKNLKAKNSRQLEMSQEELHTLEKLLVKFINKLPHPTQSKLEDLVYGKNIPEDCLRQVRSHLRG